MIRFRHCAAALAACALVFGAVITATAQIPYFMNLASDPGLADNSWGVTNAGTWAWEGATGSYPDSYGLTMARGGASEYTFASTTLSGLSHAAGSNFYISTLLEGMSNTSPTGVNTDVGLRFLSDTVNTNTNANAFVVDINIGANAGRVRVVNYVNGTSTVYPSGTQGDQFPIGTFNTSDTYLLAASGSYNASDQLTLAVEALDENHLGVSGYGLPWSTVTTNASTNGTGGSSVTFSAPSNAQDNFGFYMSSSSGGASTYTTNFGSLTVTPEPSTCVLLGVGAVCLAGTAWRRRRR
jgi:hypothetical protein